jgi:hypothetical protein
MNRMSKSTTYSWRLSAELKARLEAAARDEKSDIGTILERVIGEWLEARGGDDGGEAGDLARRRAALMACAGTYKGDGTSATNEQVRRVMGDYLEVKRGRQRRPR